MRMQGSRELKREKKCKAGGSTSTLPCDQMRRLLSLFLLLFLPDYAPGNGQVVSGWGSGAFGRLKHTNHWPLDNLAFVLPTPWHLTAIESSLRFSASGVPNLTVRRVIDTLYL